MVMGKSGWKGDLGYYYRGWCLRFAFPPAFSVLELERLIGFGPLLACGDVDTFFAWRGGRVYAMQGGTMIIFMMEGFGQ